MLSNHWVVSWHMADKWSKIDSLCSPWTWGKCRCRREPGRDIYEVTHLFHWRRCLQIVLLREALLAVFLTGVANPYLTTQGCGRRSEQLSFCCFILHRKPNQHPEQPEGLPISMQCLMRVRGGLLILIREAPIRGVGCLRTSGTNRKRYKKMLKLLSLEKGNNPTNVQLENLLQNPQNKHPPADF